MNDELKAAVTLIFCGFFGVVAAMYIIQDPFMQGVEDSTKYNLYAYSSNSYYETTEVSYNMEDYENATYLYDFSLNGNHGNNTGATDTSGYFGRALESWSSGYINHPDLSISDVSFTIEAWIQTTYSGATWQYIATCGSTTERFRIGSSGNLTFISASQTLYANTTISTNVWNHIAAWYDKTLDTMRIYLNGTCIGEDTSASGTQTWSGIGYIGARDTGATQRFQGKIDEFRIYKGEARTQAEIQADMAAVMGTLLTINTETSSDVVQLWYENASTLQEQQTSGIDEQVIFNIFTFSGQTTPYNGIVQVSSEEMQYEDVIRVYEWGDIYAYSVPKRIETWAIAALVIVLSIVIGMILVVVKI